VEVEEAEAGDIVIISGMEDIGIGVTICDKEQPVACRWWRWTSRP
jgi:GTP-binding protein